MRQKNRPIIGLLLKPAVAVLILSIATLLFSLYLNEHVRPYNSDDVSWQNILLGWRPFNGHEVDLGGSDNFILKLPFFIFMGHFFEPSRRLITAEAAILAVLTFTLFYTSSLYFLKKFKVKLSLLNLLPFIWLASFGYSLAQLFLNPILRNFELGLSFVVFVLAAKVYYGELEPLKSWAAKFISFLVCLLLGALIYNDPYFLFVTIVPIILFFTGLYLIKKTSLKTLLIIYSAAVLSLVSERLSAYAAGRAGIKLALAYPVQFIDFDGLFNNIKLALHGILVIFGADFFGRPLAKLTTISSLVNFTLVAFTFYCLYRLLRRRSMNESPSSVAAHTWTVFFGLLAVFILLLYTLSTLAVDLNTYRYFEMLVLVLVLLLVTIMNSLKNGRLVLGGLLLLAILLNLITSVTGVQGYLQPGDASNRTNSANFATINKIQSLGLRKGYAPYWDSHINSYLAKGSVKFLPVFCANGTTLPYYWLVDRSQFTIPADKSFYIVDPDLPQPPVCFQRDVINQFGKPAKRIIMDDKTILIYDYDIYAAMQ